MELLDGGSCEADIIRMYSHITAEHFDEPVGCPTATGAKLPNVTWTDSDAIMRRQTEKENAG